MSEAISAFDYSQRSRLHHTWTENERAMLCILHKFYAANIATITKLCNHIFARALLRDGNRDGLLARVFTAQFRHLRHHRKPTWVKVNRLNEHDCAEILKLLETRALKIGISLQRKPSNTSRAKRPSMQLASNSGLKDLYSFLLESTTLEVMDNSTQQTTTFVTSSVAVLPVSATPSTPPLSTPREKQLQRARSSRSLLFPLPKPSILYRFHSGQSAGINKPTGFRAGVWATGRTHIPHPDLYDTRIIDSLMQIHLSRFEVPTPFISCFETPLSPLHRTLRAGGDNAFFSIFDVSLLDQRRIFSAEEYLHKQPLSSEVRKGHRYTGLIEWLVWGEIPQECLVVTVSAKELFTIAKTYNDIEKVLQTKQISSYVWNQLPMKMAVAQNSPGIGREMGMALRKFFSMIQLPNAYVKRIAEAIIQTWYYYEARDISEDLWQEFRNGLLEAEAGARTEVTEGTGVVAPTGVYFTPPVTPEKLAAVESPNLYAQLLDASQKTSSISLGGNDDVVMEDADDEGEGEGFEEIEEIPYTPSRRPRRPATTVPIPTPISLRRRRMAGRQAMVDNFSLDRQRVNRFLGL